MIIAGCCSCGLSPFPSSGVNGSRPKGLAETIITRTKKRSVELVIPATQGRSSAWRRAVSHCASEAKTERTTAQRRSDPFCPAQKAEIRKYGGRFREVYAETYSTLKSCAARTCQRQNAAVSRRPSEA